MPRYWFSKDPETSIDDQITKVLKEMDYETITSERYEELIGKLERLHALKAKESRPPVSRDTLLIVAGNLLGILVIVIYEQKHVMTSKSFTQILRPKAS